MWGKVSYLTSLLSSVTLCTLSNKTHVQTLLGPLECRTLKIHAESITIHSLGTKRTTVFVGRFMRFFSTQNLTSQMPRISPIYL
jgi:hypothetical protein